MSHTKKQKKIVSKWNFFGRENENVGLSMHLGEAFEPTTTDLPLD
jgi:hypothetical protein